MIQRPEPGLIVAQSRMTAVVLDQGSSGADPMPKGTRRAEPADRARRHPLEMLNVRAAARVIAC
jgi:hypothetical protein